MVKNVTVNATLTPSGNLALADAMMGKVIQPQPRWSPGSLANSILSSSEVPLLLLLTASRIIALDVSGVGIPTFDGAATADLASSGFEFEGFNADESTTKSKTIACGNVTYPDLDLTVNDSILGDAHPLYQVLKPEKPTFTVLSLVNAFETALLDNGDFYLMSVDQRDTTVRVGIVGSDAAAVTHINTLLNGAFEGVPIVAAFDLTYDVSDPGTPSYGWE